jgi:hypothetical protein
VIPRNARAKENRLKFKREQSCQCWTNQTTGKKFAQ